MRAIALAAAIVILPAAAFAQAAPSPTATLRALRQTIADLTQAWTDARIGLADAQDQAAVKDAKIKALEDKLPRQEPVRGPSGDMPGEPK